MSTKRVTIYREERAWFYFALLTCGITVSLYMYFVSASVVHVVMRKELDAAITETSSHVASLETTYIEAQHEVSADIASLQGFERNDDKIYIDMTAAAVALLQN